MCQSVANSTFSPGVKQFEKHLGWTINSDSTEINKRICLPQHQENPPDHEELPPEQVLLLKGKTELELLKMWLQLRSNIHVLEAVSRL